jgi:hypothetical protein
VLSAQHWESINNPQNQESRIKEIHCATPPAGKTNADAALLCCGETGPVWKLSQREDQDALSGQGRVVKGQGVVHVQTEENIEENRKDGVSKK